MSQSDHERAALRQAQGERRDENKKTLFQIVVSYRCFSAPDGGRVTITFNRFSRGLHQLDEHVVGALDVGELRAARHLGYWENDSNTRRGESIDVGLYVVHVEAEVLEAKPVELSRCALV